MKQLLPEQLTLVTAARQTEGRGRFHRRWVSPANVNLYVSFCFFLNCLEMGRLPQVLALEVIEVLKKRGMDPILKWPNDILVNGKKIAGILTETTPVQDQRCIIVGLGLNVNMPLEALQEIDQPATSIMIETQSITKIEPLLHEIVMQFSKGLNGLLNNPIIAMETEQ